MTVLQATHFHVLEFMSEDDRANRSIMSMAVQQSSGGSGLNLKFASDELKDDFDFVRLAVQDCGSALEYASEQLASNREIVLTAVQATGHALLYCTNASFRADREIVLTAVSTWGDALQVASPELQNDREIVRTAMQHSLSAIRYASDELKADPEIGLLAVQIYPDNMEFVTSDQVKGNKDVALTALQREIRVFQFLNENLQNDVDVVCKALWKDSDYFRYEFWDADNGKLYCQDIKARIKNLASVVITTIECNRGICQDTPLAFARDWQRAIDDRHNLLFHLFDSGMDDKALPREVRDVILEFSMEAHCVKELQTCEPLINLFTETTNLPRYDWIQFLKDQKLLRCD
jgi:hypothetical protein